MRECGVGFPRKFIVPRNTSKWRMHGGGALCAPSWCRSAAADLRARPGARVPYLRCLLTIFVMSNIETWPLPPKIGFRFSSALIMRRFFASCRPFRLM